MFVDNDCFLPGRKADAVETAMSIWMLLIQGADEEEK